MTRRFSGATTLTRLTTRMSFPTAPTMLSMPFSTSSVATVPSITTVFSSIVRTLTVLVVRDSRRICAT